MVSKSIAEMRNPAKPRFPLQRAAPCASTGAPGLSQGFSGKDLVGAFHLAQQVGQGVQVHAGVWTAWHRLLPVVQRTLLERKRPRPPRVDGSLSGLAFSPSRSGSEC